MIRRGEPFKCVICGASAAVRVYDDRAGLEYDLCEIHREMRNGGVMDAYHWHMHCNRCHREWTEPLSVEDLGYTARLKEIACPGCGTIGDSSYEFYREEHEGDPLRADFHQPLPEVTASGPGIQCYDLKDILRRKMEEDRVLSESSEEYLDRLVTFIVAEANLRGLADADRDRYLIRRGYADGLMKVADDGTVSSKGCTPGGAEMTKAAKPKVFLVCAGTYDDFAVIGAYDDRKLAEALVEIMNGTTENGGVSVREYDLNSPDPQGLYFRFQFRFTSAGERRPTVYLPELLTEREPPRIWGGDGSDFADYGVVVSISKNDREDAIRIATDVFDTARHRGLLPATGDDCGFNEPPVSVDDPKWNV